MAEPTNTRLNALQNLSNQLPVANARFQQGRAAARDIQLQQLAKQAPAAPTPAMAQQTGAAVAQQAGQQMVQGAQDQLKQQGQVGQLGLQAEQQQARQNVADLEMGARQQGMDNVQRLAKIDERAKQELYDAQMSFRKDEMGRTLFNERQLADYAAANARSDEEYQNYVQNAKQASDRAMQIQEHSYKLVVQDLEQKIKLAEQQKDQKLALELAAMKRAAEEEMARKRNRSANRAQMFQAGGTILGAAAGAAIAGPGGYAAGASAGASLGGAAGGLAATQTDDSEI